MASTESGRGTKRSIDDVHSEEDALERYGKLLWDSMIYHKSVIGIVAFLSSSRGDIGFFVIGFDPDGTRWKASEPTWPNYADIWLATRQHPGETVETIADSQTGLSRPTQKELSKRMTIFVRKARDKQEKYRLSRSKSNHHCPANSGAIVVSDPTHKSHHVARPQASLPTALENGGFDFFDGLAHAARQRSIQETNGLTAHIKYLSTMLDDTRAALSNEKQSHRRDVEDTRKEIAKLTEEAEKNIRDLSAALDEERKSSKDRAETADAKLEELKKAHGKDMQGAESEIQQLRADIDANKIAASSELKKEKEARRKAAEESSAVVQKLLLKHRKEQQDLSFAHGEEKKSLLKASEESSAKIQSLEAKVKDLSSKVEKERQNRHEAINNAVEEAQRRMAKHHNEVMEDIVTRHNEEKCSLQNVVKDSETELLRLKDDYQKQSQELEKEKLDRRQDGEAHEAEIECWESENKKLKEDKEAYAQLQVKVTKLERTNYALQTKVDRFMAVANDESP